MQQTSYAYLRSRDPRNQVYGNQSGPVATPYSPRPAYPSVDMSIYNRPAMPNAAAGNLNNLVTQAQEDQEAMTNPGFARLLMEQQGQVGPSSLQGINIGVPEEASANPDLSTEEGLESAGISPRLPVTPPATPASLEVPKEIDPKAVEQAQGLVTTVASSLPTGEGVAGATAAAGQERVNKDLMEIAKSKDPNSAWKEMQKLPFYQNSNFYTGLMGVGLSIMSGKSPIEAFQIGQGMAQQDEVKSQLEANRDALIDQGYSPDSVAAAIATGDASQLRMRQRSVEEAQQDALNAEQRANREWDRRTAFSMDREDARQRASDQRFEKRMDMQLQKSRDLIDYRAKVADDKAKAKAESYDFSSRDINSEKYTPDGSNVKSWAAKRGYFTAADKEYNIAQEAIKSYEQTGNERDRQRATAAFKQLIFNLARGEIGENRSLQGNDLAEFAEDPSIVIRTVNDVKLKSGFTPTQDALGYVKAGIDTGIDSMDHNIIETKEKRIRANAKTLGAKKATALVNRAFGAGWHDPLKAFGDEDDTTESKSSNRGSLSGGALSSDWMLQQQP